MKKIYTYAILAKVSLVLTLLIQLTNGLAQPVVGVYDQSFGNAGVVTTANSFYWTQLAVDIKLQPDQKILVLSITDTSYSRHGEYYMLRRYLPNGMPDNTFAGNGVVIKGGERPLALALQTDGKILVSSTTTVGSSYDFALTRYNTNGSRDNSFGTNGEVVTDFRLPSNPTVYYNDVPVCVFVLPGGKIIQGGYSQHASGSTINCQSLVRYNADGTIDATYGNNGKVMLPATLYTDLFNAATWDRVPMTMVMDANQKVVASSANGFIRLNADGTKDNSFGINGFAPVGHLMYCFSGVVQPDGKMVFAGNDWDNISLRRYDTNGTIDPTFDTSNLCIVPLQGFVNVAGKLLLKPNGQFILAVGDVAASLVGVNADGTKDMTFGKRGRIGLSYVYYGAALQIDGKVLVASAIFNGSSLSAGIVLRLENRPLGYNYLDFRVFYDRNSNGVQDYNDYTIEDATATIIKTSVDTLQARSKGIFSVLVDTGTYRTTIKPDRPYYNVVPAVKITSHPTFFNEDSFGIALQPIPGIKDVATTLVPLSAVRPGSRTAYKIIVKNYGTDTLTGTYKMYYDGKLGFFGAYPTPSGQLGDTLVWSYDSLAPLRSIEAYVVFDVNSATAHIGDTIKNTAVATPFAAEPNVSDNSSDALQRVTGSFDPNDKTEAHLGRISKARVNNGEYLLYTIRFQNTGNDTAFNVYLRDTLDSKLDWTTIETVASSHSYQATLEDNKLMFTFSNINLVDSVHNEPKSHGYITYRIKPKANVQVGDVITNRASIYFDYNLPVRTNLESTTVVADIMPLKLLSFTARKDGKVNRLGWSTANEENVNMFEVERSADGRVFKLIDNGQLRMDNAQHEYSYVDQAPLHSVNYYRLKIINRDGSYTYSAVRVVNNDEGFTVSVRPNPVKDRLQIEVTSEKRSNLLLQIISQEGKVLIAQPLEVSEGSTTTSMGTSVLPKGTYWLRIMIDGAEQTVVKFEKI